MKSILKTYNAGSISNLALISMVSVLITACGGADSTNPRTYDDKGPEIIISGVDSSIAMTDSEGNPTVNVILDIGSEYLMTVADDVKVVNGKIMEDTLNSEGEVTGQTHTGGYVDTGATARDVWDGNNIDPLTTELYKIISDDATCEILTDSSIENDTSASISENINTDSKSTYCVVYSSKDASDNHSISARTIIVNDLTPPVITIEGANPILLEKGAVFDLPAATYIDAFDSTNGPNANANANAITITLENIVNQVDPNEIGNYNVIYSAEDLSGNIATKTLSVVVEPIYLKEIVVFRAGEFGSDFEGGMNAYDQGNPNWGTCSESSGCPNINFELVNDQDRGTVIEIEHADTNQSAGVFIESTQTVDLRGAKETGKLIFDVWSENGISINVNIGCGYPCESPTLTRENVAVGEWETITIPTPQLLTGKLNATTLRKVNTFGIHATSQKNETFRVDNIIWKCEFACEGTDEPDKEYTPWVKADPAIGYVAPTEYEGYVLDWSDEFDGNEVNPLNWNLINKGDGFGNEELQYYRSENASVEDGLLVITADIQRSGDPELPGKQDYSSAKLTTQDLYEFKHGRVDIRAVVAEGKGMWSAGWMLGSNVDEIGWPYSGEIDIFDTIGGQLNGTPQEGMIVHNAYWNAEGPNDTDPYDESYYNQNAWGERRINAKNEGVTFSNQFHVFSIEWDEDKIRFFVDGVYEPGKDLALSGGVPCEGGSGLSCVGETFNQDFYLILNVAVGGDWPESPDDTTQFPRGMLVDYVRVYKKTSQ
jgi:beta-glucanase (GH16 family)